ncbi:unnamed protein product [Orchesella dallaii]|uniref:Uncharacterized protein n=1 Tax=Orchesella dallaii TaxID=48710 RepID=A0ABP1RUA6_9HEXA
MDSLNLKSGKDTAEVYGIAVKNSPISLFSGADVQQLCTNVDANGFAWNNFPGAAESCLGNLSFDLNIVDRSKIIQGLRS